MKIFEFLRSFPWWCWPLWATALVIGWFIGPIRFVDRCDCDEVQVVLIPIGTGP